jgi:hypothetical protein
MPVNASSWQGRDQALRRFIENRQPANKRFRSQDDSPHNAPSSLLKKWDKHLTTAVSCGICDFRFGAGPALQQAASARMVSYMATMFAVGLTGWRLWQGAQIQRALR